jgi:hypothetical protein
MPKTEIWVVADDLESVRRVDAVIDTEEAAHVRVRRGRTPGIREYAKGDWFGTEELAKMRQLTLVVRKMTEATKTLMNMGAIKTRLSEELRPVVSDEVKSHL